jgi:hypothetical protein
MSGASVNWTRWGRDSVLIGTDSRLRGNDKGKKERSILPWQTYTFLIIR